MTNTLNICGKYLQTNLRSSIRIDDCSDTFYSCEAPYEDNELTLQPELIDPHCSDELV